VTVYRNAVIKRRLEATLKREFHQGARLLHAGCGSGQVDEGLHTHARITAIDISPSALGAVPPAQPGGRGGQARQHLQPPLPEGSFDGAYNLGVVEHFDHEALTRAFTEVRRVLKRRASWWCSGRTRTRAASCCSTRRTGC
jgi:2-polyprenyl-3-methyl-5-hydroxy-6-metoxy-1,4-benzoquinol methylase